MLGLQQCRLICMLMKTVRHQVRCSRLLLSLLQRMQQLAWTCEARWRGGRLIVSFARPLVKSLKVHLTSYLLLLLTNNHVTTHANESGDPLRAAARLLLLQLSGAVVELLLLEGAFCVRN